HAAAPQSRVYFGRGEVTFSALPRSLLCAPKRLVRPGVWLRIIREITMKFSRRSFGVAVAVAALTLAGSLSVAFAGTAVPYSAEAFKAAQ
ncbi:hypothetical protein ACQJ25_26980, partial [Klebsiella pneumoniae]|uniref:hypothetical protein n=1 Tax=Klebsiella pneumoniae TaxID=573 RepID=UPI003CFFFAB8